MSHSGMSLKQALTLSKTYAEAKGASQGGYISEEDVKGTSQITGKPTNNLDIILSREGHDSPEGKATVVVMKSRKNRTGVESHVIQKFDI